MRVLYNYRRKTILFSKKYILLFGRNRVAKKQDDIKALLKNSKWHSDISKFGTNANFNKFIINAE